MVRITEELQPGFMQFSKQPFNVNFEDGTFCSYRIARQDEVEQIEKNFYDNASGQTINAFRLVKRTHKTDNIFVDLAHFLSEIGPLGFDFWQTIVHRDFETHKNGFAPSLHIIG